jgi:hypothetical protein
MFRTACHGKNVHILSSRLCVGVGVCLGVGVCVGVVLVGICVRVVLGGVCA